MQSVRPILYQREGLSKCGSCNGRSVADQCTQCLQSPSPTGVAIQGNIESQRLQTTDKTSTQSENPKDHGRPRCNNCSKIIPVKFCLECNYPLCDNCVRKHRKSTVSKSHTIEEFSNLEREASQERYHDGNDRNGIYALKNSQNFELSLRAEDSLNSILQIDEQSLVGCSALGRRSHLGSLYREKDSKFLDISILRRGCKPHNDDKDEKSNNSRPSKEVRRVDPNDLKECFEAFDLGSAEILDVLLSNIQPQGVSSFLLQEPSDCDVRKQALLCKVLSKKHMLDPSAVDINSLENYMESQASHIVVGIELGAINILQIENYSKCNSLHDEDVDIMYVTESLYKTIKDSAKKGCMFNLPASLIKELNKCQLKLFDDRSCSQYEGAAQDIIGQFFAQESDNIIKYWLLPLENLNSKLHESSVNTRRVKQSHFAAALDKIAAQTVPQFQTFNSIKNRLVFLEKLLDKRKSDIPVRCTIAVQNLFIDLKKEKDEITERLTEIIFKVYTYGHNFIEEALAILSLEKSTILNQFSELCNKMETEIFERDSFLNRLEKSSIHVTYIGQGMTLSEVTKLIAIGPSWVFFCNWSLPNSETSRNCFFELISHCKQTESINEYLSYAYADQCLQYVVIDVEMNPEIAAVEPVKKDNQIYFITGHECQTIEQFKKNARDRQLCIAYTNFSSFRVRHHIEPLKRAILDLPCPNNYYGKCPSRSLRWLCEYCRTSLQYDLRHHECFCRCGSAPIQSYSFRCSSMEHRCSAVSYNKDNLLSILEKLRPVEVFNILLLGVTEDINKFMNNAANYLSYESIIEATEAEVIEYLCPTSISVLHSNSVEHVVRIGMPHSEKQREPLQSTAQQLNSFTLVFGDTDIKCISVAELDDLHSIESTSSDSMDTLEYLLQLEDAHTICILLPAYFFHKSDKCIYFTLQILSNIHINAKTNITFCYFRSDSYPDISHADCISTLKTVLEKCQVNPGGDLLSEERVFFIDDNAFDVIAKNSNWKMDRSQLASIPCQWNKSRNEILRLFRNTTNCHKPHKIIDTLNVGLIRRLWFRLSDILFDSERSRVEERITLRSYSSFATANSSLLDGYTRPLTNAYNSRMRRVWTRSDDLKFRKLLQQCTDQLKLQALTSSNYSLEIYIKDEKEQLSATNSETKLVSLQKFRDRYRIINTPNSKSKLEGNEIPRELHEILAEFKWIEQICLLPSNLAGVSADTKCNVEEIKEIIYISKLSIDMYNSTLPT